jgi:hypothetical protein
MQDACAYAVMQLPQEQLRKVLLKGSIRMIKSLIIAYPQALGAAFLDALAPSVSPATLRVLVEEVNRGQILTPSQVRSAECEFLKIINDEHLLPEPLTC